MEIGNDTKEKLVSYIREAMKTSDFELEAIVRQGKVKKTQFATLLQYFRSIKLPFKFHEETLSVSFKHKNIDYRYDIIGKHNINTYCSTNSLNGIPQSDLVLLHKTKVEGKYSIFIDDYDMKVNLKVEKDIDNKDTVKDIKSTMYSLRKNYRFKKRFSFFSEDGLFRYDLTIVKSSSQGERYLNLLSSGIFASPDTFEIEVEYLRSEKEVGEKDILNSLLHSQSMILRVLDDDDHIISATKKKQVIANYLKLCRIDANKPLNSQFAGPMPITLEKKNLLQPELGISSIHDGYTVTDKADGERELLYFDEDGKAYMIGRKMVVRYTGISSEVYKSTLVDGEFITRTSSGNAIKLFACFDMYFDKGENIAMLPLMAEEGGDSRIVRMKKVAGTSFSGDKSFKVTCKEFLGGKDILKDSKKILEKQKIGNINYKIDGLIFTPKHIPVGGAYVDSTPVLTGTWLKTFKWKPPEDNSIDFLVKTDKNAAGGDIVVEKDGVYKKVLKLYVSYDVRTSEKITPYKYLMNEFQQVAGPRFQNKLFEPPGENASLAYVALDSSNVMKCENGDYIYDGGVVEFTYNEKSMEWIALRERKDKTDGNGFHTAMNVWNSMKNPVTKRMITGKEDIDINVAEAQDDDIYYNRIEKRDNSASKAMLDFHNHWVKNISMVAKLRGRVTSVFDIACGKGNDVPKYINANIKTIIGVDVSDDNITNQADGAYARHLRNVSRGWTRLDRKDVVVFLPLDCSKVIDASYIDNIKDEQTKDVVKVLWGEKSIPALQKYNGVVKRQVDLVACQFAIHYFFQTKHTLHALIANVNNVLKNGGYFMGTCLDGKIIDRRFRENKETYIQGLSDTGRTLWRIDRQYDTFDSKDFNNNFGLEIKVYIETINKPFSEYLVDFDLLTFELAKYGIRLLNEKECQDVGIEESTGTFRDLYKTMESSKIINKFTASARQMSEKEKEYSFMNRWFIFRKDVQDDVNIPPKPVKKIVGRKKIT